MYMTSKVTRSGEVENSIMGFIHSIENNDWDAFKAHVSDNVTMIHIGFNDHFMDSEEFFKVWRGVFDSGKKDIEKKGLSGPPFFPFKVEGLRVDLFSDDVAVVTFSHHTWGEKHLRTCVVALEGGVWRLVHLHGSSVK